MIKKLFFDKQGQAIIEFTIVAPIFLILFLMAPLQLGMIMNNEITVLSAAREGVRWASITGGSSEAERKQNIEQIVNEKVEDYLTMSNLDLNKLKNNTPKVKYPNSKAEGGEPVTVIVEYEMDLFIPTIDGIPDLNTGVWNIAHEVTTVLENI
ncbi:MAG: TadE family protein [archaeon]